MPRSFSERVGTVWQNSFDRSESWKVNTWKAATIYVDGDENVPAQRERTFWQTYQERFGGTL